MLHPPHVRSLVRRALAMLGSRFNSPEAEELVMETIAMESEGGTYLKQLGGGPALGITQVEPRTFEYLRERFSDQFDFVAEMQFHQLEYDLLAAIIMCRLKYYTCPGPIPKSREGRAEYWDRYYNANRYHGFVQDYLRASKKWLG